MPSDPAAPLRPKVVRNLLGMSGLDEAAYSADDVRQWVESAESRMARLALRAWHPHEYFLCEGSLRLTTVLQQSDAHA